MHTGSHNVYRVTSHMCRKCEGRDTVPIIVVADTYVLAAVKWLGD